MTDKTTEAIDRTKEWIRDYGHRSDPVFVHDLKTLIDAAKGEQRQELVRRFAVALVSTEYGQALIEPRLWSIAEQMADTEP